MKAPSAPSLFLGLAVTIVAALALRHILIALPFPYPMEYPEGITVHWAQQAATGASLYPAIDPSAPLHNPYTPLLYRLIAPLQTRLANPFAAARLASLAGLLLCSGAIAWLLRNSRARFPIAGVMLFALSSTVLHYGTTARVDLPALGLALTSLAVLYSPNTPPWRTALAGVLACAAILTKPTFLAATAAGLLITTCRGRRPLTAWLAGFTLALAAGLLLFGAPPQAIITHLWTLNRLPWDIASLGTLTGQLLARHPILATGLVLFILHAARERDAFWWYAILALPTVLLAGKTGADQNYFLELLAIASVATVRLASKLAASTGPDAECASDTTTPESPLGQWSTILPLLAAIQVLLYLPVEPAPVFTRTYEQELAVNTSRYTPSPEEAKAGALVVEELRRADSVLSQSPGLMIAAGRPATWDAYQFTQRARAGRWDDTPLAERTAEGAFALVLMQSDPVVATNYFPAHVRAAVEARYTLHRDIGPWRLLKPKDP